MKMLLALCLISLSATAFGQACIVRLKNDYTLTTLRVFDGPDCQENMMLCSKTIRLGYGQDPHQSHLRCERTDVGVPTYGVNVVGIIEDQPFNIVARDASELYINCMNDIRRVVYGGVDEIIFTVNNGRFVSTKSERWYNDKQICSIIEQEARRSYGQTYTSPMRVVGMIERTPFQIEALDRPQLLRNCIAEFSALNQGAVDEITYSLNGGLFQRISTNSWWNTPVRACSAMLTHLDNQIR